METCRAIETSLSRSGATATIYIQPVKHARHLVPFIFSPHAAATRTIAFIRFDERPARVTRFPECFK